MKKRLNLLFYYFLSLGYLEIIFRLLLGKTLLKASTINMLIFLLALSIFFYIISKLFKEKGNKIIFFTILSALGIWFSAQFIVKDVFDFYISFSVLQIADQIGGFFLKQTILMIFQKILPVILMFIPLILGIIFKNHLNFKKNSFKKNFAYFLMIFIFYLGYYVSLNIKKDESYSAYILYHDINNPALNIESLGVMNAGCIDLYRLIFGFEEKISLIKSEETFSNKDEEITYDYNNLSFDFDSLINNTSDETVKSMTQYFQNESGTLQNEYTGYFEGKNLIFFMAESFNEIAVRQDVTPTLYKLVHGGFSFSNFYSQTIGSTLGGEFQELTGLYANLSVLSTFRSGTTSFPMGLGTVFKDKGYSTFAYHDHYYTFQNRNTYLKTLGFDNFKGCYNGLEKLINCNLWPESDYEMIDKTFDEYASSENPFMVFYATVSGHGDYSWSGNLMANKNKEEYLSYNLNYSVKPSVYLAANMELDKALELLLTKLEEKGILDDTVIVLAGDHYPYMLSLDEINEISSYEKDSVIEVNHSNLIIYNSAMETVNVSKVASQMDILPTVYNLFNIAYDSRLIIGKDILSTSEGLAMFGNLSWVSDKGRYYSATGNFVANGDVSDDYVTKQNQIVNNKANMSKYIITKNYYKILWDYLQK